MSRDSRVKEKINKDNSKKIKSMLWDVKYNPKKFKDLLLPSKFKATIENSNQHLLFSGQQGVGKTTTAKIIASAEGNQCLFINASLENGINTIRDKIMGFCSTGGFGKGLKYVILDEFDNFSSDGQSAFRGTVEKFHETTRFILTCNNPERIIDPIKSRIPPMEFDFQTKEEKTELLTMYVERIKFIVANEGMTIDKEAISHLIKTYYPDMRAIIKTLQYLYENGTRNITKESLNIVVSTPKNTTLFNFIITNSDPRKLFPFMGQFRGKEMDTILSIIKNLNNHIFETNPKLAVRKSGQIAVICHKYGVESKDSLDLFITLLALCHELSLNIK